MPHYLSGRILLLQLVKERYQRTLLLRCAVVDRNDLTLGVLGDAADISDIDVTPRTGRVG